MMKLRDLLWIKFQRRSLSAGFIKMSNKRLKQLVAAKAVELIDDGMIIGIGTGSTAAEFIPLLIKRVEDLNLSIHCICTSKTSRELLGNRIPIIDDSLKQEIDMTFDGADRADPTRFQLIKGGGGALLREKLVAKNSKKNVVLVDYTKLTHPLQGFPVATEIVPFGYAATIKRLYKLGYKGSLRLDKQNHPLLTDNHNFTFDIHFEKPIEDAPFHHNQIKSTLGVVDVGLFLDTASVIYAAMEDETVKIIHK